MENPSPEQTQAEAPQQADTKLVASEKKQTRMVQASKKVWIQVEQPIRFKDAKDQPERYGAPGQVLEVDESVAKEFCDRKFHNVYPFTGERVSKGSDAQLGKIVRAKRISAAEAKEILEGAEKQSS